MNHKKAGHTFLSKLGKKRLRPGGKKASYFLYRTLKHEKDLKILEVACNKGTTTFGLLKKFKIKSITSVDIDPNVIDEAKQQAKKLGLENKTNFLVADAKKLPFENESFDVIINEAMLTMMTNQEKDIILKEYYRVLKKGGKLLTHDIFLKQMMSHCKIKLKPIYQEQSMSM